LIMAFACLFVLICIGSCLAVKTPVVNVIDPTPTAKPGNVAELLTKAMSKVPADKIFASKCTETEWSAPIGKCFMFGTDMENKMTTLFSDATKASCMTPTEKTQGYVTKLMAKKMEFYPLMAQKMPKEECGFCGRKIQCCKSDSFLTQSYRATPCPSAPCSLIPLNTTEITYLKTKYPKWNVSDEMCQFGQLLTRAFDDMAMMKVAPISKLFQQMMGVDRPTFNCFMDETTRMCKCCCFGRKWDLLTKTCVMVN